AGLFAGAIVALLTPTDRLWLARRLDGASGAKDRFASAVQLANHPRRDRARLVCADALHAVLQTRPAAAIPLRWPRELRWFPVLLVAVALVMWLTPAGPAEAAGVEPEVSAEEWN